MRCCCKGLLEMLLVPVHDHQEGYLTCGIVGLYILVCIGVGNVKYHTANV